MLSGTEEEKINAMKSGKDSASDFKSSDVSTLNWKQARNYFKNNNVSSEKQEEIFSDLYKNIWNTGKKKKRINNLRRRKDAWGPCWFRQIYCPWFW